MTKYRIIAFLLSILLTITCIAVISKTSTTQTNADLSTTDEVSNDMKGVWVSYITLDMQNTDMSEKSFTHKIESIVNKTKENGFNTIIFQVRPFCDALYNSQYFPYSHILTGVQGKEPDYDPLEIMCSGTAYFSGYKSLFLIAFVFCCSFFSFKNSLQNRGFSHALPSVSWASASATPQSRGDVPAYRGVAPL